MESRVNQLSLRCALCDFVGRLLLQLHVIKLLEIFKLVQQVSFAKSECFITSAFALVHKHDFRDVVESAAPFVESHE